MKRVGIDVIFTPKQYREGDGTAERSQSKGVFGQSCGVEPSRDQDDCQQAAGAHRSKQFDRRMNVLHRVNAQASQTPSQAVSWKRDTTYPCDHMHPRDLIVVEAGTVLAALASLSIQSI